MQLLEWTYLFAAQAITLLIYYRYCNRYDDFELKRIFQSRVHFLTMNLGVIISCCYLNIRRQLFCVPVPWTLLVLGLFGACFLALPFISKRSRLLLPVSAFAGLGFFVAVYIILFGRQEYLIFAVFNIVVSLVISAFITFFKQRFKNKVANALWFYAAYTLAPYFLLLQLVLLYRSMTGALQKWVFMCSSLLMLLIGVLLALQMKRIFDKVEVADDPKAELQVLIKNPVNNYLVELMLGAHWKYHTELCIYDGRRPPFHDPVLIVCNKLLFPFGHFANGTKIYYYEHPDLYKKIYPGKPRRFNCRCAMEDRLWDIY